MPGDDPATPRFRLGDRVRLRAEPARMGVVVDGPRRTPHGWEYDIFLSGDSVPTFSESALLPADDGADQPRWETTEELRRDILLAKLANPLTDSLYAYRASRTKYEPYQFRPALKFLRGAGHGLLIADEVGLGKTIEAAIVYLELKARMDISRVFVLCPARLTSKWHVELRSRFDEEFGVLDASSVRLLFQDFDRLGHAMPLRAIGSFELLRRPEFADRFEETNFPIDLLIIDEAHHLRNAGTRTHEMAEALVNNSEAVLLLTATPLNLHSQDLYNLLRLIAPDEFDDYLSFEQLIEPNAYINRAIRLVATGRLQEASHELRLAESTAQPQRFLGNPYYLEVRDRLEQADGLSMGQRVEIQRQLLELNTISSVFTRTRKREVQAAAQRRATSIRVQLSEAERAFYERVLERAREQYRTEGWGGPPGFAIVMKERQAASCLVALRETFEVAARYSRANLSAERSPFDLHDPDDDASVQGDRELLQLSRAIGSADSKFDKFLEVLTQALGADATSKALVFSFFKHTLSYLYRRLRAAGYRVEVIHGDVPVSKRNRIIEEFRHQPDLRVLLSSEVGAEGLDFEFCDVLINYDLPWNPMQVEQRIGRLDRFGQEHPVIRIFNFFIEDTVETRIFDRLYTRIGIFERAIGDIEEILGQEIAELTRAVFQSTLTPEEEEQLAEQAALRIEALVRDQEELDRSRDELLGQGRILDQLVDETVDSGRVVSPAEVKALVTTFLCTAFPRARLIGDEEEPCWTLDIDAELSEYLLRFIEQRRLHARVSDLLQQALSQRKRLAFTFEDSYARDRRNLEFVTIRHPLAEAAREYWLSQNMSGIPAASLEIGGPPDEQGTGSFFLYVVDVRALVPRTSLEAVVVLDDGRLALESSRRLLAQMQGQSGARSPGVARDRARLEAAREIAAAEITKRRLALEEDARKHTEAGLARRVGAINASFEAKIRRVQEVTANQLRKALGVNVDPVKLTPEVLDKFRTELIQLRVERQTSTTKDEISRLLPIITMKTGHIRNLQARQASKLTELEKCREVAVSSQLIACGRVRILSQPTHNRKGATT